ncbi:Aspartic peptidase domain superfamily [Sesbania bispinosa]|nr:Aspartic peptidase domain superfamily [Sesbania bispinosa]
MNELAADVKHIFELMETRDKEYSLRFEVLESSLDALTNKRPAGDSSSGMHSSTFQETDNLESDNLEPEPDPPDHIAHSDAHGLQEHHLSYNALSGSFGLGTMQFQGFINGMMVHVLLDGGSSDNFLQPRLAHCLKLPIEPVPDTQVMVGSGHTLLAEGLVRDLEVKIQRHSVKLPVYLLPVAGDDMVLGAT